MNQMGGMNAMANMGNLFGGGGGNGMFGGGLGNNNMFGGSPSPFQAPQQTTSTVPTSNVNNSPGVNNSNVKTHGSLQIKTLPLNTKQSTLYSSSSSVAKIFLKLKQLVNEKSPSLLDENNIKILNDLQNGLTNRKEKPNFSIPAGTFRLIEQIRSQLTPQKVFPVIDILRLLVLHPTASEYYGNPGKIFL